jgi:hypothetical protein
MPRRRRPPLRPNWYLILVLIAQAIFWIVTATALLSHRHGG